VSPADRGRAEADRLYSQAEMRHGKIMRSIGKQYDVSMNSVLYCRQHPCNGRRAWRNRNVKNRLMSSS
jgi:hypothetical protein